MKGRAGWAAFSILIWAAGCGVDRNFTVGGEPRPGRATPPSGKTSAPPTPAPSAPERGAEPVPASSAPAAPTPLVEDQPAPSRAARIQVLAKGVFQSADGCQTTGRRLTASVPDVDHLDEAVRGPVPGIEFREIARVNGGGYRHVRLSGNVLEFELYAQGKGLLVEALGAKSCRGGEGATVGYDVVAHYR